MRAAFHALCYMLWCTALPLYHINYLHIPVHVFPCSCGSVVRALRLQCKGCGFNFQGTHVLTCTDKKMYYLNG